MTVVKSDVIPSVVDDAPFYCLSERGARAEGEYESPKQAETHFTPNQTTGHFKFFPIVVAIIAVLVAIAVPLFVGSLNDAEQKVKEANIRAVRGAAVSELLTGTNSAKYMDKTGTDKYYDDKNECWYASARVSEKGEMSDLTIEKTCPADLGTSSLDKTGYCEKKNSDTFYTVYVAITDVTKTSD